MTSRSTTARNHNDQFNVAEHVPGPPQWDENPATVDVWIERVRMYCLGTKSDCRPIWQDLTSSEW